MSQSNEIGWIKSLRRATPRLRLRQYLQSLHPTYDVTLICVIHGDVLTRMMHNNVFGNNVKSDYNIRMCFEFSLDHSIVIPYLPYKG